MEESAEGPLPGDYPLQLVSKSEPTGLDAKDVAIIGGAVVVVALLAVGAFVFTIFLGHRHPRH
jgi:hypothetical protein